jgi:hypothetical protein
MASRFLIDTIDPDDKGGEPKQAGAVEPANRRVAAVQARSRCRVCRLAAPAVIERAVFLRRIGAGPARSLFFNTFPRRFLVPPIRSTRTKLNQTRNMSVCGGTKYLAGGF